MFCAALSSSLPKDVNVSSQNPGDVHLVSVSHAGVSGPLISSENLYSASLNPHCNLHCKDCFELNAISDMFFSPRLNLVLNG